MSNNYHFSQNQIHIPTMFNMDDVVYLESLTITKIKLTGRDIIIPASHYYIEEVAIYLYTEWINAINKTLEESRKQDLLIYLLPLIDKVLRGNTKFLNGLPYEDVFQDLCLHITQQISRYDKNKGKLFSFITSKLQWHIKTVTIKNSKQPKNSYLSDYEIGYDDNNSQNHYIDLLNLLNDVIDRENIEYDYKLVFLYILDNLKTENFRLLTNNIITNIAKEIMVSRDKVIEAMAFLKDEFGTISIETKLFKYSNTNGEL